MSRTGYRHVLCLIAAVALPFIAAHADTLFLTNGNQIAGKIDDANADPVVLEIQGGKISFDRAEIQSLQVDENGFKGSEAMKTQETAAAEALMVEAAAQTKESFNNTLKRETVKSIKHIKYSARIGGS